MANERGSCVTSSLVSISILVLFIYFMLIRMWAHALGHKKILMLSPRLNEFTSNATIRTTNQPAAIHTKRHYFYFPSSLPIWAFVSTSFFCVNYSPFYYFIVYSCIWKLYWCWFCCACPISAIFFSHFSVNHFSFSIALFGSLDILLWMNICYFLLISSSFCCYLCVIPLKMMNVCELHGREMKCNRTTHCPNTQIRW